MQNRNRFVAALRRLWRALLDVVLGPALLPRPERPAARDDLSLGLLFRRPSLWNRRFWRSQKRRDR